MKKIFVISACVAALCMTAALYGCAGDGGSAEKEPGGGGVQQEQGEYFPEEGAVYVFDRCVKFDRVTDGVTVSLTDTMNNVYKGETITFTDGKCVLDNVIGEGFEAVEFSYEKDGDRYAIVVGTETPGVEQTQYFTVTEDEFVMYGKAVVTTDGTVAEQTSEMVFTARE